GVSKGANPIVPAALRQREPQPARLEPLSASPSLAASLPTTPDNGTVVLDVEQGGIVVPSFVGKSVRSAIELAESRRLDLEVVGSGVGQTQVPAPGAHVPTGSRITVTFGR